MKIAIVMDLTTGPHVGHQFGMIPETCPRCAPIYHESRECTQTLYAKFKSLIQTNKIYIYQNNTPLAITVKRFNTSSFNLTIEISNEQGIDATDSHRVISLTARSDPAAQLASLDHAPLAYELVT